MPTVQRLSDIKRTVSIPWGEDEVIQVTYRLAALNVKLSNWLSENGDDRNSLLGWIERVVCSWDVTDDGKPIEPTVENLEKYGFATSLLRIIMDEIYRDSSSENLKNDYGTRFLELSASPRGSSISD